MPPLTTTLPTTYMGKVESAANHYWIALFEAMHAGKIKGAGSWARTRRSAVPMPALRRRPWTSSTGW